MSNSYRSVAGQLGLPEVSEILDPSLRVEYQAFLEQLNPGADGSVVVSDPYALSIDVSRLLPSVSDWCRSLDSRAQDRLLLLSLLAQPLDLRDLWRGGQPRLTYEGTLSLGVDATLAKLTTPAVPYGIWTVTGARRCRTEPALERLLEQLPMAAAIQSMSADTFGYEAWQVAKWSNEWAVVYGITDAGHEAYPFPWLLGFIRSDDAERNFIELLSLGASRFDMGFYCTMGSVVGDWPLAKAALPANEYGEFNRGWEDDGTQDDAMDDSF
jgi:hypothetical protein